MPPDRAPRAPGPSIGTALPYPQFPLAIGALAHDPRTAAPARAGAAPTRRARHAARAAAMPPPCR